MSKHKESLHNTILDFNPIDFEETAKFKLASSIEYNEMGLEHYAQEAIAKALQSIAASLIAISMKTVDNG